MSSSDCGSKLIIGMHSADCDAELDDLERPFAQRYYFSGLVGCLKEPLSQGQQDYLVELSPYSQQHYLLAIGTDGICEDRALRNCEAHYPGKCVALP